MCLWISVHRLFSRRHFDTSAEMTFHFSTPLLPTKLQLIDEALTTFPNAIRLKKRVAFVYAFALFKSSFDARGIRKHALN